MIALTQEKREELIAFVNASIEQRCTFYTLAKQRELEALRDQIALASLTAECKYFQWKWVRDESAVWTTTPIEKLSDAVSAFGEDGENVTYRMLFTAPPVPEIKDHQIREMVTEITDTAKKYQGCQCLRDAISKVVIKRLNGLGE